jgi:hypothetical protein
LCRPVLGFKSNPLVQFRLSARPLGDYRYLARAFAVRIFFALFCDLRDLLSPGFIIPIALREPDDFFDEHQISDREVVNLEDI